MAAPVLVDTSPLSFFSGMDDQAEKISARRLRNRDALMKLLDEEAAQGKTVGIEEAAALSKSILGPQEWLNNNAPSQEVLTRMTSAQNAKAAQTAEERRRAQFKANKEEADVVTADIQEQFAGGKTPVQVMQYAQERFGPEVLKRLNLDWDKEQQKALYKVQTEGTDQGARFSTLDEAKEFVKTNSFLPQAKKDAILSGAEMSQARNEAAIMREARTMGATLGFMDNDNTREEFRAIVRSTMPRASKEYEDAVVNRAMAAAKGANQTALTARQTSDARAVAQAESLAAPGNDARIIQMEEADKQARLAYGQTLTKRLDDAITRQTGIAETYFSKGKASKNMGVSDEQARTISNTLRTHMIDDVNGLVEVVKKDDPKELQAFLAGQMTINDYATRTQGLAKLATGDFKTPQDAIMVMQSSGIGMSPETVRSIGKEIKANAAIVKKPAQGATVGEIIWDGFRLAGQTLAGTPEAYKPTQSGMQMQEVAKARMDQLQKGFVREAAADIKGMREALQTNGRLGIAGENLQQYEFGLAMDRARILMEGMGSNDKDQQIELAQQILAAAGASPTLVRQPTPAERLKDQQTKRREEQFLSTGTGVQTGAPLPSTRLNQSFR